MFSKYNFPIMAKAIKSHPEVPLADNHRVFFRAATSARIIGFAASVLAGILLYAAAKLPQDASPGLFIAHLIFAAMFLIPGVLYLFLSAFVTRKKRWAIWCTYALGMLDLVLLGILFVTSWGTPDAHIICPIAGAFVVSIAVLTAFLRRCFEALNLSSM